MKENLINVLSEAKIFPVLRGGPLKMTDIAKALADGGINIFEVNIETSQTLKVIEEISKFSIVCAGNIITSIQAQAAIDAGAKIISSPIFHMNMVKLSKDKKIPYIAGTSTANEAYNAWKARIQVVKIYPVTALGGIMYLEDLLRPMPFLNVLPLGNVKLNEVKSYLNAGAVAVGVGRDLYEGYSYAEISRRVEKALKELGE
ncbi:MAG: bifunctional 4-hydroxy-2-oxoglutarate aldolase/2-dehydro-3-deoxy-phosphogluconate aldolase [Heliobacteriaceae bacterium]|jgi:2-dehydro-3-deoxyphosphogluconate aldolase/(4S)-4-hydroxy-2-oxoglutarate aldolase|nr:bifunctional 4-hydroxy-2-oxoglutarate aldolase/2-dehydro-3-deoxy-phosphogluconate aldolase [Heliobacteriaceae bacterium]